MKIFITISFTALGTWLYGIRIVYTQKETVKNRQFQLLQGKFLFWRELRQYETRLKCTCEARGKGVFALWSTWYLLGLMKVTLRKDSGLTLGGTRHFILIRVLGCNVKMNSIAPFQGEKHGRLSFVFSFKIVVTELLICLRFGPRESKLFSWSYMILMT